MGQVLPATVAAWLQAGGQGRAWLARGLLILVFVLLFASAGCGILTYERSDFPEAFVGADGAPILLDRVMEIVDDPALDDDEKRQGLRDLGIEDEDLLDALLARAIS